MMKKIKSFLLAFIVIAILAFSLRGIYGVPKAEDLMNTSWREDGPFELSPERGRFALVYSIVEDKSFFFSVPLARFVTPDLGYEGGNYVSLFAPGVSFLVMPGYFIGKLLGISQVGTFAAISCFAFLNFLLISKIVELLGGRRGAGYLAGIVFLFATPAFAYAVNLYQHHISTFLILASIFLLLRYKRKWFPLFAIMFMCATAIAVDNPNLFLMFPVGIAALFNFIEIKNLKYKIKLKVHLKLLFSITGVVVPVLLFMVFNYFSYGSPTQLAGTVPSVVAIDAEGYPTLPDSVIDDPDVINEILNPETQEKSSVGFFKTRNILNGLYIHLLSPDRGMLLFAPILFFGVFGAYVMYKQKNQNLVLLLSIIFVNLVLYSMWGDPWGGWAFGSRYLIPSYSILSIFLGVLFSNFPSSKLARLALRVVLIYCIFVNTLGALTTSAMPPKVQANHLSNISGRVEKYTYARNWDYLRNVGSKSYIYRMYLSDKLSGREYFFIIFSTITILSLAMFRNVYPIKSKK